MVRCGSSWLPVSRWRMPRSTRWQTYPTRALGGTPEQFGNYIRTESVRFGKVIKAAGIRPE